MEESFLTLVLLQELLHCIGERVHTGYLSRPELHEFGVRGGVEHADLKEISSDENHLVHRSKIAAQTALGFSETHYKTWSLTSASYVNWANKSRVAV